MFLSGPNIGLRALEPADVDILYQWENNREVWYLSNTLNPFSRFDLEQYVLNAGNDIFTDKQVRFMIVENKSGSTVGAIDLFEFNPSNQRVGVGVLIAEDYREKGLASEALDLVIQYCFDILQVHQVFANIAADNLKSIRLFKKKGFMQNGAKQDWLLIQGKWTAELFFQLINPQNQHENR